MGQFGYQGLGYGPNLIQSYQQKRETIQSDFVGYINGAYKTNGPVFACVLMRMMLFSEMTFQFRGSNNGRPGKLYGTKELRVLEEPWANATTGDLLVRMEVDLSLSGNFYGVTVPDKSMRSGQRVCRMRPDWVTIILGSYEDHTVDAFDPTAVNLGYLYTPGGPGSGYPAKLYSPDRVCHYAPVPDPTAHFRGMSWLQPVISEILGDRSMSTHKQMFYEHGATPNLVISMDTNFKDRKTFGEWVDTFRSEHEGSFNAYRTLYLGHGATATKIGTNMGELDYRLVQTGGEARIASAAGLPPIIVGFQAGLDAATYSNYGQARRACADQLLRPLWRNAAGSLKPLVNVPGGSELWYDDRDIPFLQADIADQADVQLTKATAIRLLVDSGYEPDSVVEAVESDDFALLKHSGLYSVQLQAPSTTLLPAVGSGWEPSGGTPPPPAGGATPPPSSNQPAKPPAQTNKPPAGGGLPRPGRSDTMIENIGNVPQLAQALIAARRGSSNKRGTNGHL
jgi:phage portal protein BeeE